MVPNMGNLNEERLIVFDSAMCGAATAVTSAQAMWANIDGDLSAVGGGLDHETGEWKSGPDPTAVVRDADKEGQHLMFRVMTWLYLTDVISEFWWPDYDWEVADFCAAFGLPKAGERRVVALGPDPGRVRKEVAASAEYLGLQMRVALQACVEAVAGETVESDYPLILMAEENWKEACFAGQDTMEEALSGVSIHYVKGVPEAREGQPLHHIPPAPLSVEDSASFDGSIALCESGRFTLDDGGPFPDRSSKDDFGSAAPLFAERLGADNEHTRACVTDALAVGYSVREAETRSGQGRPGPPLTAEHGTPRWKQLHADASEFEPEIPELFAHGPKGWDAVRRWTVAFVSNRHRGATGELDLGPAAGWGYALRRAEQALSK
jgi:hypothetical protein